MDEYQNKVGQTECVICGDGYTTDSKTGRSSCEEDGSGIIEEIGEGEFKLIN